MPTLVRQTAVCEKRHRSLEEEREWVKRMRMQDHISTNDADELYKHAIAFEDIELLHKLMVQQPLPHGISTDKFDGGKIASWIHLFQFTMMTSFPVMMELIRQLSPKPFSIQDVEQICLQSSGLRTVCRWWPEQCKEKKTLHTLLRNTLRCGSLDLETFQMLEKVVPGLHMTDALFFKLVQHHPSIEFLDHLVFSCSTVVVEQNQEEQSEQDQDNFSTDICMSQQTQSVEIVRSCQFLTRLFVFIFESIAFSTTFSDAQKFDWFCKHCKEMRIATTPEHRRLLVQLCCSNVDDQKYVQLLFHVVPTLATETDDLVYCLKLAAMHSLQSVIPVLCEKLQHFNVFNSFAVLKSLLMLETHPSSLSAFIQHCKVQCSEEELDELFI